MLIRLKRAYEPAEPGDGPRFLVDRLWPRGLRRDQLHLAAWLKAAAPSDALRKWYRHEPGHWAEFVKRYKEELAANGAALQPLFAAMRQGTLTLIYAAKDREHNQAVVLREFLMKHPAPAEPEAEKQPYGDRKRKERTMHAVHSCRHTL